ncbi:hypothetical protein F1737_04365 [Methanoplanus sp. FWC-SCC4]|uniref:Uncharacterized protein n=1 Tax=Methanochimaera problematica TaxID=2609417 RepID=A0AA97I3Z8_9EURY|nr:hypothetical protein [Methanoplanus sp. FWC-SCC4]WOF15989.1 hypothetical protein F1737_04365 [Methanoplanus sp. FWC-SCC4]
MKQAELTGLTQAVINMTIVLEGINTQMQLLREELVRNRMSKEDLIDNDVIFKSLVAEEISNIVSVSYSGDDQ